jgi:hypothetical protein
MRHSFRSAQKLDGAVWQTVREALLDPDVITAAVRERLSQQPNPSTEHLAIIEAQIAKIKRQEVGLLRHLGDDDLDQEMIADQLKLLKKQRNGFEAERDKLKVEQASQQAIHDFVVSLPEYCRRAAANIDTFTFAEKRQALQALQARIIIFPDRVVLEGILPSVIPSPIAGGGDISVAASNSFAAPSAG